MHFCFGCTYMNLIFFSLYRKIPKISPGAYTFQRPFLRGLFLEGPIFGGAYVRREICVSKSIALACSGEEIYHFSKSIGLTLQLKVNLPFLLCFTLYSRANSKYKPSGGVYSEGRFNGGFFALRFWGAYIWRGLYMEGLIFGILRYFFHVLYLANVIDYAFNLFHDVQLKVY